MFARASTRANITRAVAPTMTTAAKVTMTMIQARMRVRALAALRLVIIEVIVVIIVVFIVVAVTRAAPVFVVRIVVGVAVPGRLRRRPGHDDGFARGRRGRLRLGGAG